MPSFDQMLNILYLELDKSDQVEEIILDRPDVKGSVWKNVKSYLKQIKRRNQKQHFIDYLKKETNSSADWVGSKLSQGVSFTIRVDVPKVKNYMKDYMDKYVKCSQCGNYYTNIERDKIIRKNKLVCNVCNAWRYI